MKLHSSYLCLYLGVVLTSFTGTYCSVHLSVANDIIVLGSDLKLICDTSNARNICEKCNYRFYGGPHQKTVLYNGIIENKEKYVTGDEPNGFSLTIKKCSIEDFNIKYSCSYGFEYHEMILNLTNYELHPTADTKTVESHIDPDSNLHVRVELSMVYPEPTCTFVLDKSDIETLRTIQTIEYYSIASFTMMHNVGKVCEGELYMECRIGSRKHTLQTDISCEDFKQNTQKEIGQRDSDESDFKQNTQKEIWQRDAYKSDNGTPSALRVGSVIIIPVLITLRV